ncbi:RNA polymerase subunit sigma [Lysinibacillus yapensis]|uniref:RNA polymerase subunit sigma n=1 Tax=Ureibacillus yapensis TaxID=2304605 RepID=A0A396SJS4_9BACL|nr:RNA polymerase subunit sigma [Lysinibacillus yapensis]RHW39619.1 RNA polymerase subunit sigma [Lysinibacillus yapensis]
MSLKALELQIAIPKTFDAGKIAEQHQQNVISQQLNAHEALKKETERKQLQVSDSEKIDFIKDGEKESQQQEENAKKQNSRQKEEKEVQHPFKGNFIDFSG